MGLRDSQLKRRSVPGRSTAGEERTIPRKVELAMLRLRDVVSLGCQRRSATPSPAGPANTLCNLCDLEEVVLRD